MDNQDIKVTKPKRPVHVPIEVLEDGTPVYARDPNNRNRIVCGALKRGRSEGAGQPCKRTPCKSGNGRCKLHGGRAPRGMNNPAYKHGRHSKYLPKHLLDAYNKAQADPNLLSLREEISLVDARLSELLSKLHIEADETLWQKLDKAWTEFEAGKREAKESIKSIITAGVQEAGTWKEIYFVVDNRRKLVEGEVKRLQTMGQMITAERLTVLLAGLADAIKNTVTDKEQVKSLVKLIGSNLSGEK